MNVKDQIQVITSNKNFNNKIIENCMNIVEVEAKNRNFPMVFILSTPAYQSRKKFLSHVSSIKGTASVSNLQQLNINDNIIDVVDVKVNDLETVRKSKRKKKEVNYVEENDSHYNENIYDSKEQNNKNDCRDNNNAINRDQNEKDVFYIKTVKLGNNLISEINQNKKLIKSFKETIQHAVSCITDNKLSVEEIFSFLRMKLNEELMVANVLKENPVQVTKSFSSPESINKNKRKIIHQVTINEQSNMDNDLNLISNFESTPLTSKFHTPLTSKFHNVVSANSAITLADDNINDNTQNPVTCNVRKFETLKEVWQYVKAQFNQPTNIVGRETEYNAIKETILEAIEKGQGAGVYACGTPGLGKTLVVMCAIRDSLRELSSATLKGSTSSSSAAKKVDPFKFINMGVTKEAKVVFDHIATALGYFDDDRNKHADAEKWVIKKLSTPVTKKSSKSHIPTVIFIDEIDDVARDAVAKLMRIACTKQYVNGDAVNYSSLILLGAGNNVQFGSTDMTFPSPEKIVFKPYEPDDLYNIMKSQTNGLFDQNTLICFSRKISANCGGNSIF
jgi:hypothetical protein